MKLKLQPLISALAVSHVAMTLCEHRKSSDLEKELNLIKSKYVRLLSEQFKITVMSEYAVCIPV